MGEQSKFSVLAVIVGCLTGWAGSFAVSMGVGYLFVRYHSSHNLQPVMQSVVVFTVVSYGIYALVNVIAGYVAGAIAPANEVQHAMWVGVIVVLTGVAWTTVAIMNSPAKIPLAAIINPARIAMIALIIPAAALGGYLASGKSRNRHIDRY